MKKVPPKKPVTRSSKTAVTHHAHMRHAQKTAKPPTAESNPLYVVKRSKIHGRGVYAARRIRSGTRIIEYVGDRISHEEADSRYEMKADDDGHTFLFVVDDDLCIDAGVGGNPARFINHKCDANCETIIEGRRVFIEAIRTIQPGEELGYDYQLTWESTDDPDELALYNCRCGAANCRGTMLDRESIDAKKKREKQAAAKKKAVAKGRKPARNASGPEDRDAARLDHRGDGRAGRDRARRRSAVAPAGRPQALQVPDDGEAHRHGSQDLGLDRQAAARAAQHRHHAPGRV